MKKFYDTMSPDAARHILRDTEEQAIADASKKVASDGRTRYVVKIICIVEPGLPPVRIRRIEDES